MADLFISRNVPTEYDPFFLQEEFHRLQVAIAELEAPLIILSPQHVEPPRRREGMVVFADGTDWNPDGLGGVGLFQYVGVLWVKL